MKQTYTLAFLIFFIGCTQKDVQQPPSVIASIQRLTGISQQIDTDTTLNKTTLMEAYVLAEHVSNQQHDSLIAVVSQSLSDVLIRSKKRSEARLFALNGLRFGHRFFQKKAFLIGQLYHSASMSYYGDEDFKMALTYADSVKIESTDTIAQVLKTKNHIIIGECYQRLKNMKAAETFYQNVQPMVESYLPNKEKVEFYNRFSFFLIGEKKFAQAIKAAQNSVDILENTIKNKTIQKGDTLLLGHAYYYIAFALQDSTAYKSAEPYYLKALNIYKKQDNMEGYRRGLLNMGLMYRYDKQFDKAINVLTEGIGQLNILAQTDINILRKAKLFNNRAEVFMDLKDFPKAISDHDSAIFYLTIYDRRASLTTLLLSNQKSLIWAYGDNAKAYAMLANKGLDTEGYVKSLKMTQKLIEVSDNIRADYFSDDAKINLANDIKPYIENAIGVCQKLYQQTRDTTYLNKAFAFVEYSRSMVLYENARLDNQLTTELKAENADLKNREAALIAKNNVEELQNYLRLKRQFREKIKSLNQNTLASVSTLQTALLKDNKTAFIEYFVGDSSIFVFSMLNTGLTLAEIPKPKDFEKQIDSFRQGITQTRPVHEATAFMRQSAQLYALLLRGVCEKLPPSVSQCIIAPDGVLSYLPFELLSVQPVSEGKTDFRKVPYLLHQYSISYAYSANLLLEQKRAKKGKTDALFAGFASKYENKDTLQAIADVSRAVLTRDNAYELKGAKEEVAAISQLINGKTFVDAFATEGVFKREANRYRILHFAMHSLTNDKEPTLSKLLFTLTPQDTTNDNDLTAAELYTMHLNAELAVLSACNTGYGTLSRGEGVMSLARAFTYAGVPATVTSLWKVPDLTTREIMVEFYKNLKQGMSKDVALREAKLTYLKNAPESIAANPYFWAGFVPMGNMEAMDMSERTPLSIWGIFAALGLVAALGFWFFKRKVLS